MNPDPHYVWSVSDEEDTRMKSKLCFVENEKNGFDNKEGLKRNEASERRRATEADEDDNDDDQVLMMQSVMITRQQLSKKRHERNGRLTEEERKSILQTCLE
jgi:broad specificity polyphosphatase/5'/3'-nucleotidase SurE